MYGECPGVMRGVWSGLRGYNWLLSHGGHRSAIAAHNSTDCARQQHNSTLWALHTNNMLLTGAHRYPAHHSARQEMNSFLRRDPRKMKISDNGKLSMWIESWHMCYKRLARKMTGVISQLTTDVRYFVLRIFFVFCKPINCPSIVLVVAFLCKCLTALLDGATSDWREQSVTGYSQHKTLKCCKIIQC